MCLVSFSCFAQTFYYLLLFLVPIYGSFCGKDVVLRFSLMLCLQSVLSSVFNNDREFVGPVLFLVSLATSVLLPFTLLPSSAVWLYDVFLWTSEPVWLLSESVGLVHLSIEISREIADRKEDQPQLAQIISTAIAVVSLAATAFLTKCCFDDYLYISVIAIIVVVYCVLYAVMQSEDFVHLTDMAILVLLSSVYVYASYRESHFPQSKLKVPPAWADLGKKSSLVQIFLQVLTSTLDGTFNLLSYLQRIFTPWMLLCAALRIFGIMYGITLLKQYLQGDEDRDEELSVNLFSHWRSPLSMKLTSIFMYTQFVIYHIQRTVFSDVNWFSWCLHQLFLRLQWIQFAAVNSLYGHYLWTQSDQVL